MKRAELEQIIREELQEGLMDSKDTNVERCVD